MPKPNTSVTLLTIAAATTVAILVGRDARTAQPPAPEPDFRVEQFEGWSPTLERGGSVKLVRRLCETQKAEHLSRTGSPAPEIVDAGGIDTFGPLPGQRAFELSKQLDNIADGTLAAAESMPAGTLTEAHAQLQQMLHGLKARAAAEALRDGHYWTIGQDAYPRLPTHFGSWQLRVDHTTPDGVAVDVFVPLDLRAPELEACYDAVLSLEAELRRDHSQNFNRMALEDRRSLSEDAWRSANGEKVERAIPSWFWKLDIDTTTWLATPARVAGS